MPRFNVALMLAKEVVDQVEARNAKEAEELVLAGHGERISGRRARLRLLCMMGTERAEDSVADRP